MKKLLLLTLVLLSLSCKQGDIPFTMDEYAREMRHQFNDVGIPDEDTNFQFKYTTAGGMKIESVVAVPPEFLAYADEAATKQVTRFEAMFPAWTNARSISGRRIFIVQPSRTYDPITRVPGAYCVTEVNDPGSPCLYISGQKAAGATFGCNDLWQRIDLNPPIIIPHQQFQNWTKVDWFKNAIEYENEHLAGWLNRQFPPEGVFYHYTGVNDTHPWTWGEAKGLADVKRSHFVK